MEAVTNSSLWEYGNAATKIDQCITFNNKKISEMVSDSINKLQNSQYWRNWNNVED